MSEIKELRAWRLAAQGLARARTAAVDPAAVVANHGWVRTVGGTDAYLAFRARQPGVRAADIHAALEAGALRVSPAARGCIYVVPEAEAGLALSLAERLSASTAARTQRVAGFTDAEIDALVTEVVTALAREGPQTTDGLRKLIPPQHVRGLGADGKRAGVSSTLPPALRAAEFGGRIERSPSGGRLDSERYLWRLPTGDTGLAEARALADAQLHARLADRFCRWAGPTGLAAFVQWSGLGQRAAKAALATVAAAPRPFAHMDAAVVHAEHAETWTRDAEALLAEPSRAPVALLPYADNLWALNGGPSQWVDSAQAGVPVPTWGGGGKKTPLAEAKHLMVRTAVADGRLAGLWEHDPATHNTALFAFAGLSTQAQTALAAEAKAGGAWLVAELGHARTHALDNEASLTARAQWIRGL